MVKQFSRTSIIDGNFLYPIKLIMIFQYERIRVFRSSSLLGNVHVRAGSWIYHIHLVYINLWLTCVYFLRGSSFPHSLRTLVRTIFLLTYSPPPSGVEWFLWYLHSTRNDNSRIQRLCDTFVISKCVWQVISNLL
jgi:hypothetical protein